MTNLSKAKKGSFIACLACLGAPDDYRTECTVCSGSGESSGLRNKEAALHEADSRSVDIEGLIDAVKCMGFNPYRLSMLFSKHYCMEVHAAFDAIRLEEDALMEYFATEDEYGKFIHDDGRQGDMNEVWFKADPGDTQFMDEIEINADIAKLPDLKGYGNIPSLRQAMAAIGAPGGADGRWTDEQREALAPVLATYCQPRG